MQEVQAGDAKKRCPKYDRAAGGVVGQSPTFPKNMKPLLEVKHGESGAQDDGSNQPLQRFRFLAGFGSRDSGEHGQTAGEQDKGHDHAVHNAGRKLEGSIPIGSADPQIRVSDENGSKSDSIGNYKKPSC